MKATKAIYQFRDNAEHPSALSITQHRIVGRQIEVKSSEVWWTVNALLEHVNGRVVVNVIDWRYSL